MTTFRSAFPKIYAGVMHHSRTRRPCSLRDSVRADHPPFLPSPDDPVTPSDPNAIPSIPYQCCRPRVSLLRHPPQPRLSSEKSERSANLLKINFRLSIETARPRTFDYGNIPHEGSTNRRNGKKNSRTFNGSFHGLPKQCKFLIKPYCLQTTNDEQSTKLSEGEFAVTRRVICDGRITQLKGRVVFVLLLLKMKSERGDPTSRPRRHHRG